MMTCDVVTVGKAPKVNNYIVTFHSRDQHQRCYQKVKLQIAWQTIKGDIHAIRFSF
jgi:hypothetical protein